MAVALVDAVEPHRHALAVDEQLAVAHHDVIARQADQPLDVVRRGIGGQAEHDHVAAVRLSSTATTLVLMHRQPQAVGVLVDEDEIAVEQRRHHRVGRNAERLEQERADQQHDQDHREERARVLDDHRLAHVLRRAAAARPRLRRACGLNSQLSRPQMTPVSAVAATRMKEKSKIMLIFPCRPATPRGTPPAGSRPSRPASCASCLLSASRGACACA